MKTEHTNYGLKVTLPATEHTSEFVYQIRLVRTLNKDIPEEEKLIARLEKREKPILRKLMRRIRSMWIFFSSIKNPGPGGDFDKWESSHGIEWNKYFHDAIDDMIEKLNGICKEFCEKSQHGWSY